MKCFRPRLFSGIVFALVSLFPLPAVVAAETGKAKNVIIMIGDGMGFNCHVAGSYYRYGELGKQSVDSFPVILGCTTYAQAKSGKPIAEGEKGYDPDVFWETVANMKKRSENTTVTDSAAASTAIHGGVKTISGRLGLNGEKEPKPVLLISEIAKKTGRGTGAITTVAVSHATPAGFSTHNDGRRNYNDIFHEQITTGMLDVLMGGGHPTLNNGQRIPEDKVDWKYTGGKELWEKFEKCEKKDGDFLYEKMLIRIPPCQFALPPHDGTFDDSQASKDLFIRKYKNPNLTDIPTLSEMAVQSLNFLDAHFKKGFVLMIEGGAIDGANHSRDIEKSVLEQTAFMKSVDAVCDWIEKYGSWDDTLVIVTADHDTAGIWGPGTYEDKNKNGEFDKGDVFNAFEPVRGKGIGKMPAVQFAYGSHTNALVPLWAKGAGAERFREHIRGNDRKAGALWNFSGDYVDNTDIFKVMKSAIE